MWGEMGASGELRLGTALGGQPGAWAKGIKGGVRGGVGKLGWARPDSAGGGQGGRTLRHLRGPDWQKHEGVADVGERNPAWNVRECSSGDPLCCVVQMRLQIPQVKCFKVPFFILGEPLEHFV